MQEVNLANNQIAELPPLWVSIWGSPHTTTGLLVPLTVGGVTVGAGGGEKKKEVKVLVLGNPLMSASNPTV